MGTPRGTEQTETPEEGLEARRRLSRGPTPGEGDVLGRLPLEPRDPHGGTAGTPQVLAPPLAARPPFGTRGPQHPGLCPVCSPSPRGTGSPGPRELVHVPTVTSLGGEGCSLTVA